MLQITARMTAAGIQQRPAEFFIRQLRSAAPHAVGEMRQCLKFFDATAGFIEFAETVLPGWRRRLHGRLHGEKMKREFGFVLAGRPLEGQFVQPLHALLRLRERFDVRPIQQIGRLLHHERAVHQKQRLLRHGRIEALRAGGIRAGKVERAEQTGKVKVP